MKKNQGRGIQFFIEAVDNSHNPGQGSSQISQKKKKKKKKKK